MPGKQINTKEEQNAENRMSKKNKKTAEGTNFIPSNQNVKTNLCYVTGANLIQNSNHLNTTNC